VTELTERQPQELEVGAGALVVGDGTGAPVGEGRAVGAAELGRSVKIGTGVLGAGELGAGELGAGELEVSVLGAGEGSGAAVGCPARMAMSAQFQNVSG
jgi:hypothetical protein